MNEIEFSIDTESTLPEHEQNIRFAEELQNRQIAEGNLENEIEETSSQASSELLQEVEENDKMDDLQNGNKANQASSVLDDLLNVKLCEDLARENADYLSDPNLSPAQKAKFMTDLLEEQRVAGGRLNPEPEQTRSRKKWMIGGLATLAFVASVLLIAYRKQISDKASVSPWAENDTPNNFRDGELVPDSILNAEQNYLSLMMQAAADMPVNFSDFGISNDTYSQMRQLLLLTRDNITEDAHWQMQADQSILINTATQKPYTLSDHLISLDFLFAMLKPLYPAQPFSLDCNQAISTLADALDLSADNTMNTLYRSVMQVAPESTGITRLQRIALLRSAIVRAVARSTSS